MYSALWQMSKFQRGLCFVLHLIVFSLTSHQTHTRLLSDAECCRVFGLLSCRIQTRSASKRATHVLINIVGGDALWFHCSAQSLGLKKADLYVNMFNVFCFYIFI